MTNDPTTKLNLHLPTARTTAEPDPAHRQRAVTLSQPSLATPDDGNDGDVEALAKVLYAADSGAVVLDMSESEEMAEAIVASGWLDGVRRKAGDDRAAQIAQAIDSEARVCNQGADWRWGLERAARIARETR